MKERILDILEFSWILIKENKGKLTTIILLFLSIWGVERVDEYDYSEYKLKSTITTDGSLVNQFMNESKSIGWIVDTGEDKVEIIKNESDKYSFKDGNLIVKSVSDGFVFLVLIIIILSGILFACTFSSDSDINWNLNGIKKDFLYSKVNCVIENGFKHYVLYDRLLFKLDVKVNYGTWEIEDNIQDKIKFYLRNKNLLESWMPLSKKREKQLAEILK